MMKITGFLRILAGVFIIWFVVLLSSFMAEDHDFEVSKNIDILVTTFRELNTNYVDEIDSKKAIDKGIASMLQSLDPYTEFIPEEKIEDFSRDFLPGEYAGIGVLIAKIDSEITVTEVNEGYPAQKAGLIPGDIINKVDNKNLKGINMDEITKMLKGVQGSSVSLEIRRMGVKSPLNINFKRSLIQFPSVTFYSMLENDIAYIKLDRFLDDASKEVKNVLIKLKSQAKPKGIILDLRGNGGGLLAEAVKICNLFLPQGTTIVSQKGNKKAGTIEYKATFPPIDTETPLMVLVDRQSASASEALAGAIQDTERGIIIGQRTFGKGLVQSTVALPYRSMLKLTVAKYYTPSGRCIQALDYTNRRSDGSVEKVPDSLISAFKTLNDRLVYDGSGIFPDIELKPDTLSSIIEALYEKNLFFKYANIYFSKHNIISPAKDFNISDEDYNSFTDLVKKEKFDYSTETEDRLKSLRESMQKENIDDSEKITQSILDKIKNLKTKELLREKKLISEILESEIASRYYYQKGKIESTLDNDNAVLKAKKLLQNPTEIKNILSGAGSYKMIGKPAKNTVTSLNSSTEEEED